MAKFVEHHQDEFRPDYGDILWTPRLNNLLEATGIELKPIAYKETEPMQITQENTIIYINQIADEMDVVAVNYDLDADDVWTFYWRESFVENSFEEVTGLIGNWAMSMVSLYPMKHIVEQYTGMHSQDLNTIPDWLA